MKHWNKFAYGKTIFLLIFSIIIILNPIYFSPENVSILLTVTLGALIGWIIFGILITYLIVKIFNGRIAVPKWNNNPLNLREPLGALQFIGIGAAIFGISNLIGDLINYSSIGIYGFQNLFTGIGILISIRISLKVISNKPTI